MSAIAVPPGFRAEPRAPHVLVFADGWRDVLERAGLADPARWPALIDGGASHGGRGRTARVETDRGSLRLKAVRRGGLLAAVWRDRVVGASRLLANLSVPAEALRRGVPTPRVVALVLREGPPGLFRGWLAQEEVAGAADLLARLRSAHPPTDDELDRIAALVRRAHDAGLVHRDLNVGNLLLVREPPAAFVIDLDRAGMLAGPLPWRSRVRSLARLERSWLKWAPADGERTRQLARLWRAYGGDDDVLVRRLARARRLRRPGMLMHRLAGLR